MHGKTTRKSRLASALAPLTDSAAVTDKVPGEGVNALAARTPLRWAKGLHGRLSNRFRQEALMFIDRDLPGDHRDATQGRTEALPARFIAERHRVHRRRPPGNWPGTLSNDEGRVQSDQEVVLPVRGRVHDPDPRQQSAGGS